MEATKDLLIDDAQKNLFSKMLEIGVDPTIAKKIMSFWMFLESKGFKNIYQNIIDADNAFLRCVCAEAEMALAFLESENNLARPTSSISCPITWKFAGPDLSPNHVFGDKETISTNILAFQNNVCNVAFEDLLKKKGNHETAEVIEASGEGSSENREIHASKLNPLAKEWSPAPEEERSLFMTFSRGHPLSKAEIVNYFQRKYGDCVDDVFIHVPREREPEFGKIVFRFSWIPNAVLQNKESVIFYIGGKTICLKKYKAS